jgi:hypothetical protein
LEALNTALSRIAGSPEARMRVKREIYLDDRWAEHLYDQLAAVGTAPQNEEWIRR